MQTPRLLTVAALFGAMLLGTTANAQTTVTVGAAAGKILPGTDMIRSSQFSNLPSYIRFSAGNEINQGEWTAWIGSKLNLGRQHSFTLLRTETDKLGHKHYRYQQTYNGVPVTNGVWLVHTKAGKVYSMNGLLYSNIPTAGTAMAEATALNHALTHVGAATYRWQRPIEEEFIKRKTGDANATWYPKGELVYCTKGTSFKQENNRLAWKFNIYASAPLSRAEVFVDAITGEVIYENEQIHEADVVGTAITAYSGTQPITTDSFGGGFRLRESGRGNGIFTYNMLTGTDYGASVDFTDADNTWNNVNPAMDEVATDAHFGAEATYDYYMNEHGRNSIDNAGFALESYVHYDVDYVNAFWDGSVMTYGDGDGAGYNPFTALDIAGHEITHGLVTFTANLDYNAESGALNESFADIFGVTIEWLSTPAVADWLMGEDIGTVIRDMSFPNAEFQPDTYFGTYWASLTGGDNGGVHTNSGVPNYWYYLLCQGGSGTNDNGDAYVVNSIGMTNAAAVAYRNLTVYLTNTSGFDDARFYAIVSATDLFGGCTPEVEAVTNAWYAVGVGPEYVAEVEASFLPDNTGGCVNPLTVNFSNTSMNGITYTWDFGDGGTSTSTNPSHVYTVDGIYTVTLIADGGLCGIDTTIITDQIFVGQAPDPVVTNGGRCDAGTVDLAATATGTLSWYTVPSGGSPVATGSTYTTPSISSTTTYYVEANTGGTYNAGPADNTIGGGGYSGATDHWLIFTAYQPFTLTTVDVTANGAGNRTFELRNSSGTVLQSATINCPNGPSTITLNFSVPVGTDLELGTDGSIVPNLYRNTGGVSYPYTVPGVVSITGSDAGPTVYYYCYNWECVVASCTSDRVPVTAAVATVAPSTIGDARCGAGVVNLSATGLSGVGTLEWYTVPTGGTSVNSGTTYSPTISSTTNYYVEEQMPPISTYGGPVDNTFGTGGYFSGDQHLIFDVTTACTLHSVKVYAGSAGNRTVELRDNTGTVISSIVVNVPAGESRITLDFPLTSGTDFELGWAPGSSPDLYRNNASATYPYTIPGYVSITNSSAGTAGYYYAYYDWEITTPGCATARTLVTGTVNTESDATITSTAPLCSADAPINLTAVDAGGTWTGTGITDGTLGTFDPSIGAGTYTVTYTITGTCGDVGTANITVTDAFDATITPATVCTGGGPITLTAVDGGGTWSGTGITNATTGEFDPSVGAGTYTITYTITGACGDTDMEDIVVVTTLNPTIGPVSSGICNDDAAFTMTAADAGGTWTATCGTCINSTTGAFDPTAAGAGTWTVTYTIAGPCGSFDTQPVVVGNCTSVGDLDADFGFSIFPNPASNNITITINNAQTSTVSIAITNGIGQQVWSAKEAPAKNMNVNVENLSRGVYFVKVNAGDKILTKKLVIN
ncbi:MAG TPA: M4 family metallopeptidase [Flavobacteriales bacterium]|nr:M4 family metallopeptidase [Flavobacteriales bacterium]